MQRGPAPMVDADRRAGRQADCITDRAGRGIHHDAHKAVKKMAASRPNRCHCWWVFESSLEEALPVAKTTGLH